MTEFGRSGSARGPGSFSRGRGGAGSNRNGGDDSYVGHNPSFSQQQQFNTSQGVSHQGYQTSQGLPQHQGYQTSQGLPQHQGYQTSQGIPQQSFQTSQGIPQQGYQTSQGYNSGQQGEMRSQSGFDRSRSGMGASFSRGQGSQSGFATSRQAVPVGGGLQERVMHQLGGQGQQVLSGGPDSNDEWLKRQQEAILRNMNVTVQETPAKKLPEVKEVVTIEPEVQIQRVGVTAIAEHPRVERIPAEQIVRHPREQVTPPPSLPRPIVQTQSVLVPVPSVAAVSGLISSVIGATSKDDLEQISEVTGLLSEAFRKLDMFIKSKK